ncbi:protein-tyrosine phosphatase-like protein [Spinellus fusiger]|nr:protein-tyrosine phosphatase-like protein [Spinellus fusiger]
MPFDLVQLRTTLSLSLILSLILSFRRSEKTYKSSKFNVPVSDYTFDDHQSPPFDFMLLFCQDASDWLQRDPAHVIAVHCKAGKGRTGTMIAALLLYLRIVQTAHQAMTLYGEKRTRDGQGITVPSQLRYVHYFEKRLHLGNAFLTHAQPLSIVQMTLTPPPRSCQSGK